LGIHESPQRGKSEKNANDGRSGEPLKAETRGRISSIESARLVVFAFSCEIACLLTTGDLMTQESTAAASALLVLSGPPGAGKTTIARTLADSAPRPTVHLVTDLFYVAIRKGFY